MKRLFQKDRKGQDDKVIDEVREKETLEEVEEEKDQEELGVNPMLGNKSEPQKAAPESRSAEPKVVSTPSPTPITPQSSKAQPVAVIGPKIRFKGELVGEEDLLIQGQVEGTIDLKDNNLTIGEQGTIKANVLAKTITVEGSVEGDLFGQERISILSSSNVKGNVVADRVTLEDGAKFRGSIDMDVESRKSDFQKVTDSSTSSLSSPAKKSTTETA